MTPAATTPGATPNVFGLITSRIAPLQVDNIDTDQIIPARFLKITDSTGLGTHLFEDLRRDAGGELRQDFVLNRPDYHGVQILLAGDNFGCGSSREHAAWALKGAGIRAVISTSFADIFRGNALKNGILPVALKPGLCAELSGAAEAGTPVTIDLEQEEVRWGTRTVPFSIDPFARSCLLQGVDELGYILAHANAIAAFEHQRTGGRTS